MMNTFQGIAMDAWIDVDGDCPMSGEVVGSQAQIELGHSTGSLHLVLTERGLGNLVDVLTTALTKLRSPDRRPTEARD
jgi:hypothetical protein